MATDRRCWRAADYFTRISARVFGFTVMCVLLIGVGVPAAFAAQYPLWRVQSQPSASNLNHRTGPGVSYAVIRGIPHGTVVEGSGESAWGNGGTYGWGTWRKVYYSGSWGWCFDENTWYDSLLSAGSWYTPTTSISFSPASANGNNGWYKTVPSVSISRSSGIATHYNWNSGGNVNYTGAFSAIQGNNTVNAVAQHSNGTWGDYSARSLKVDSVAPKAPTVSSSTHSVNVPNRNAEITVNWSGATDGTSGLAGYLWSFTSGAPGTPMGSPAAGASSTYTFPAPGDYYFNLRTLDNAGNVTVTSAGPYSYDPVGPVTDITLDPSAPNGLDGWYLTRALITLESEPGAGITYFWDSWSGAYVPYVAPFLAEVGDDVLRWKTVDLAGNETTGSIAIKTDPVAPMSTNVAAANVTTSTVDLSWSAASDSHSGIAMYAVRDAEGTTLVQTTGLGAVLVGLTPDTEYVLDVIARDGAGNWGAPGESVTVRTDALHDQTPVTQASIDPPTPNGANEWWVGTAPVITLTPDEPSTTEVRLGGVVSTYEGPFDAAPGITNFEFRSTCSFGFVEDWTQSPAILYDPDPPSAVEVGAVDVGVTSATVTWTGSSDPISGIAEYRLSVSGPASVVVTASPGATSAIVSDLSGATEYSVTVVAIDYAGNVSAAGNSVAFTTAAPDITAPTTSVGTTPSSPDGTNGWFRSGPTIALLSDEPGITEYGWMEAGTGTLPYEEPLTAPEGVNTLYFWSVDLAGNSEPTATAIFKVDSVAPDAPAAGLLSTQATAATVGWGSVADATSGVAGYRVYGPTGNLLTETTALSCMVTGLTPATSYSLTVRAFDAAGNESLDSIPFAFVTDSRVFVHAPTGIRVTFEDPSVDGALTVNLGSPGSPPASFRVIPRLYYDVSFEPSLVGTFTITVPYSDSDVHGGNESQLKLFHWKSGGGWDDITVSVDTVGNTITGRTNSFSPFAVMEPEAADPDPPGPGPGPVVSTPAAGPLSLVVLCCGALVILGTRYRPGRWVRP